MQMLQILNYFKIDGEIEHAEDYGNGHINKTYLVTTSTKKKYILQQINTNVFKKPKEVMENIESVTKFIREKCRKENLECSRAALEIVYTHDSKNYLKYKDNYWRCYTFIDGARTYEQITDPQQFYEVGKAIGRFQEQLRDFPIDDLHETIPYFHHTPKRYERFLEAAKNDKKGRGMDCFNEFKFVSDRKLDMRIIVDGIENKTIPLRVTHNDTKLNNVMIDEVTNEAICVVDLDTVMPGSVLYDFGDAIRIGASTAVEDEVDLSKVTVNLDLFERFSRGFLEVVRPYLNEHEIAHLVDSARIITLECGMRFLTDYLEGDQYFKCHFEKHNLVRARNQFKIVKEIENKKTEMQDIINKILESI